MENIIKKSINQTGMRIKIKITRMIEALIDTTLEIGLWIQDINNLLDKTVEKEIIIIQDMITRIRTKTTVLDMINMNIVLEIINLMTNDLDSRITILEKVLETHPTSEAHQDTVKDLDLIPEIRMTLGIEMIREQVDMKTVDLDMTLEVGQNPIILEVIHITIPEIDQMTINIVNDATLIIEILEALVNQDLTILHTDIIETNQ